MDFILLGLIVAYAIFLWRYIARTLGRKMGGLAAKSIATIAGPLVAVAIAIPLIPSEGSDVSIWALLIGLLIACALSFLEPSMQARYKELKAEEEEKERQKLKRKNLNYRPKLPKKDKRAIVHDDVFDNDSFDQEDVIGSISFTYENSSGDVSDREVDIYFFDGKYFEGYCHLAGGDRTFRVDRIDGDVIDLDTGQLVDVKDYFMSLPETS